MKRKIVQIAVVPHGDEHHLWGHYVYALDEDGTIWRMARSMWEDKRTPMGGGTTAWEMLPPSLPDKEQELGKLKRPFEVP